MRKVWESIRLLNDVVVSELLFLMGVGFQVFIFGLLFNLAGASCGGVKMQLNNKLIWFACFSLLCNVNVLVLGG